VHDQSWKGRLSRALTLGCMGVAAASSAWAGAPLELEITDPQITAVVLECTDGSHKAVVKNGVASFELLPENCSVNFVRRAGTISEAGRYTCTADGCKRTDVHHRAVSNADGRINIIAESPLAGGAWLEVSCASGFRARADVLENTAIFDGVPNEDCTLLFKGGAPARYRPITWGTWMCNLADTVAVCSQR